MASPGKEFVNGIVEGSIFAERYKICGAHRSELMQGKRSGYYFQAINYSSELGGGQTVVGIRLRKKSVILLSVIPKIMLTAAKKVGKVPLDNTTAGLANNQVVMVPKGSSTTSIPVEFIKLCAQQKKACVEVLDDRLLVFCPHGTYLKGDGYLDWVDFAISLERML